MKTKLQEFVTRNKKRNSHLYAAGLTEGYDYVVCPVSGERLSMIKDNYIVNVLEMKVDQYPLTQRICHKRKENIRDGLKEIDPVTGLTKYEVGQIKAREILKQEDDAGKSGYKKKGEKTRFTHMNKIDYLGRNGYSQLASKAIIVGNTTKSNRGLILPPSARNEFYRYKSVVTYLTEKLKSEVASGVTLGLAGTAGAYQIDHNYSVMHGFINKVSPFVIGDRKNLSALPWKQNLQKHSKSSITLSELLILTNYTVEKSESEFDKIMILIADDITNNITPSGAYLIERLRATIR